MVAWAVKKISVKWFYDLSGLVTSTLDPNPIYFSATVPDQDWAPRIFDQTAGVGSIGLCSTLCSLNTRSCDLFVYSSSVGICYLGQMTLYSGYLSASGSGSSAVYRRICKMQILLLTLSRI